MRSSSPRWAYQECLFEVKSNIFASLFAAWGGNYFILGGSVSGGQIHGQYPSDITTNGPLNIGRGRLIPTSSWENMFSPILQWMGVDSEDDLDYCMPNRIGTGAQIFDINDVFVAGPSTRTLRGN